MISLVCGCVYLCIWCSVCVHICMYVWVHIDCIPPCLFNLTGLLYIVIFRKITCLCLQSVRVEGVCHHTFPFNFWDKICLWTWSSLDWVRLIHQQAPGILSPSNRAGTNSVGLNVGESQKTVCRLSFPFCVGIEHSHQALPVEPTLFPLSLLLFKHLVETWVIQSLCYFVFLLVLWTFRLRWFQTPLLEACILKEIFLGDCNVHGL